MRVSDHTASSFVVGTLCFSQRIAVSASNGGIGNAFHVVPASSQLRPDSCLPLAYRTRKHSIFLAKTAIDTTSSGPCQTASSESARSPRPDPGVRRFCHDLVNEFFPRSLL